MQQGNIRHLFPGGNTPQGFFSYYDYIIPADAARIFIFKGGPGVGKSSFMRKTGEKLQQLGYNIEHHHCSSDNNSLDGIVIPDLNIAMIDGTAPHIVDPKNPGCVDEVLNLGQYWNEASIVSVKAEIMSCTKEISQIFRRSYRILKAAKAIYDDWEALNQEAFEINMANKYSTELLLEIFTDNNNYGAGKTRKLFASAITPDGPKNFLSSIFGSITKLYIISGEPGTGKSTLVKIIAETALRKGLDIEAFYCPLDPKHVEHLLIPKLGVGIITSTPPHPYLLDHATKVIDMNTCLNNKISNKYLAEITYAKETFWQLFNKATSYIHSAKKYHDELEIYYVQNMDFNGINKLWEQTINRILSYIK